MGLMVRLRASRAAARGRLACSTRSRPGRLTRILMGPRRIAYRTADSRPRAHCVKDDSDWRNMCQIKIDAV